MSEPVAIKPKRTLSESQLEKLKLARVKALAVKKKLKEEGDVERIKHLEGKIAKLKVKDKTPDEAPPEETEPEIPVPVEQHLSEDLEETPIVRSKKSKPKKPLVIYEESGSSDSDDNNNVVYIKKKSKRKQVAPEPAPEPVPEPPQIKREVVYNPNPMYRHNMLHHYM